MEINMETLRALREREALTLSDLAERSGVHRTTIFNIEHRGRARPSTLRKLADGLGVDVRELTKPPNEN